jgi:hypothetical protein
MGYFVMRKKYILLTFSSVLIILLMSILQLMRAHTPQQPYRVLGKKGIVEFRFYPAALMASVSSEDTTYKGSSNKNFRQLAGYIFGRNQRNESIAMTAPVHMEMQDTQSIMRFVLPSGYTVANVPKPQSEAVSIQQSPEEYVAVIRFGGWASDKKIQEHTEELEQLLTGMGIHHLGNFRFLGYNAPWDFLFRRNEVIVGISKEAIPDF